MILDDDIFFAQGLKYLLSACFDKHGFNENRNMAGNTYAGLTHLIIRGSLARHAVMSDYNSSTQINGYNVITIYVVDYPQQNTFCTSHLRTENKIKIHRKCSVDSFIKLLEQQPLFRNRNYCSGKNLPVVNNLNEKLTRREKEILSLISRGYSNNEISGQLSISNKTVSAHKCRAMRKLGIARKTELYHWLRKDGLKLASK